MTQQGAPGVRVIAFDLGGVLVDVDRARLGRSLGITEAEVEAAFFAAGLHDDVTVGRIDGEAFVREAARRLGAPEPVVRAAWAGFVSALAGADALVRSLALPCAAWSNTDPVHWARIAAQLPSLCGAAVRGVSFELSAAKPSPDFYRRAVAALGVRADEVLFLDDRADNVAAAQALGIRAARVQGVAAARQALDAALARG